MGLVVADTVASKKNKISLQDYDYKLDIDRRLFLARCSEKEIAVLSEIIYSSLHVSIEKLARNLDLSQSELRSILDKLSSTKLFTFTTQEIVVDKEVRKYFETQLERFDPDFKPSMEFLQNLLKKVPIHVLPSWYAIPRTSNNIFESLVEKYLITPVVFQRHLNEVASTDSLLGQIIDEVFEAPHHTVEASHLMRKFHLSHELLEETLLTLEFHFICCLRYTFEEGACKEVVTPFQEWKDYLSSAQEHPLIPLPKEAKIERFRPREFSFVEDAYRILASIYKKPLLLSEATLPEPAILDAWRTQMGHFGPHDPLFLPYVQRILKKFQALHFIEEKDQIITATSAAKEWLDLPSEERALYLLRHPLNHPELHLPGGEKALREAEKSIIPVLDAGWIEFDSFVQSVRVPLSTHSTIYLEKQGKTWKYHLPEYTDKEIALLKATLFDYLFEVGVTTIGSYKGKDCFLVTPFGKTLFL